jgi:hypothetical protein
MKKIIFPICAVLLTLLTACAPNLVIQSAKIDFDQDKVNFTEKNKGSRDAARHMTYVEINRVGAPVSSTPQSQYRLWIPALRAGDTWSSGDIPMANFSSPKGLDLASLTTANLVVRADAKGMVREISENDNLFDENQ